MIKHLFEQIAGDVSNVAELSSSQKSILKQHLQSILGRLDWVPRDEFDAQAAVLARTLERLSELESQIVRLEALSQQDQAENKT